MKGQSLLGLVSWLGFAGVGLERVYHGLNRSEYRSFWMRMRGEPPIAMSRTQRSVIVALGTFLLVISLLLAFGIVK
jgi:hypothetical protein